MERDRFCARLKALPHVTISSTISSTMRALTLSSQLSSTISLRVAGPLVFGVGIFRSCNRSIGFVNVSIV